jgi:hypothetical protein
MQVLRFRLNVRRWMIIVAISAAVIGIGIQITRLARLRAEYLENVALHAYAEQSDQQMLRELAEFRKEGSVDPEMMSAFSLILEENYAIDSRALAEKSTHGEKLDFFENRVRSSLEWQSDMTRKWRKAADRPWDSVSGDSYYRYQEERVRDARTSHEYPSG